MNFDGVDLPALIVSIISLIVSLIALRISKIQTKASIGKPVIMQELLELSEYLHGRRNPLTEEEQINEIIASAKVVRTKEFVLRKSGFIDELNLHKNAVQEFQRVRKEIIAASDTVAQQKGGELINAALKIEDANENLFNSIDEQLNKIFENPFKY